MIGTRQPADGVLIISHIAFTVLCVGVLLLPLPRGIQFGILVLIYNISLPLLAIRFRQNDWMSIWSFLLPLSVFQVFPDWFLSAQLKTLVFPPDGLFKIGTVSAYMALLWVIPLFLVVFTAEKIKLHVHPLAAYPAAGMLGVLIFGTSEATLWRLGSWHAQNVNMLGHIALYVIPAEFILSVLAYAGYKGTQKSPLPLKILTAFCVMLAYSGALNFFYFFFET